ncbi:GNAT family N-acetyltransferase [Streptococcus plurextorum]|uniref:GNAT family N-acetyltransferase n=1 Tax=Streptococcus plurextorum TaxID=456876 RepID=UPI0004277B0D|nr:GNAT family N-acetyltransferase [Streptococcus plurextorum]
MIELRKVTEDNYRQILEMDVSENQKTFVAPNVRSLADAWLYRENGDVFPYAVYADAQPVGFLLLEIDEEENTYLIWRLMIDQSFQGLGYGKAVVEEVIRQARQAGFQKVRVDYVKANQGMSDWLKGFGFQQIGQDEREIWTELSVKKQE